MIIKLILVNNIKINLFLIKIKNNFINKIII